MNTEGEWGHPRQRAFAQVDVFTDAPYLGNPLGVVLDAQGLSPAQMQQFTDWTHLSECSFVLPPTDDRADYRVRIFCPGRELPFAGHPTLGTAHAWLQAGGQPKAEYVVQECGVGLVNIRRQGSKLAFAAPKRVKNGPLPDADVAEIAQILGINPTAITAHHWCHNGPAWQAVMLDSAAQVLALQPKLGQLGQREIGVVGPHPNGGDAQFEVRAFFAGHQGGCEDPVTGSLNAALAQWLIETHQAPTRYVAAQGTALGRAGRVHIEQLGDITWVGGHSVSCITGQVCI